MPSCFQFRWSADVASSPTGKLPPQSSSRTFSEQDVTGIIKSAEDRAPEGLFSKKGAIVVRWRERKGDDEAGATWR